METSQKSERTRFVNFAFAAAQLLLETDCGGMVRWAAGASFGLATKGAENLVGRNLFSLVSPDDKDYIRHLLDRVRRDGSIGLMRLSLRTAGGGDITLMMGGRSFETDPETLYLALLLPPERAGGHIGDGFSPVDDLSALAANRMAVATEAQVDEGLMLFVVDELAAIALLPDGAERVREVSEKIAGFLRSVSVGGDHVSGIALGKWGIVRSPGVNEPLILEGINQILAAAKIVRPVRSFEVSFDKGGLDDVDAARALTYAIRKFADDPAGDFNLRSLRDSADSYLRETVELVTQARAKMDNGDVEIVYQPIVRIDRNTVHHVEALSRVSGIASIQDWITFIEESGMIQDYDLALCQRVLVMLETQAQAGWRPMVAVNLSGKSLGGDMFYRRLKAVLDSHALVRKQLMMEVTETAHIRDPNRMARVLSELQALGHSISLDDVGSGTTSLETLRILPADFFKIDGSVVRGAVNGTHDSATLSAIMMLAKSKGAEVIAEQIETQQQARAMFTAGAKFGQGWYYGKPTSDLSFSSHRHQPQQGDPAWVPMGKH